MSTQYYASKWGDIRLWISDIKVTRGRDIVEHEMSKGDDHPIQDRGAAMVRSSLTILFDWMVGEPDLAPLDRLRRFVASIDGESRLFQHPVEGSFLARIKNFEYAIDSSGVITGTGEILPAGDVTPLAPAGSDGIPASGAGAVDAAADAADIEFNEVNFEGRNVPEAARLAANNWATTDDLNPRAVLAETGSLTSDLGELADALEGSLVTWQAFKAVVLLAEAVRAAAETATSDTAATFIARIGSTIALRAFVAGLYGAEFAEIRYRQVLQLNDVANPAWLEPGTELVMPQVAARGRSA